MFEVRVYDKSRDIPWKGTYIRLVAGMPMQTDDEEMVEHIRKFHNPEQHRAISIKEIVKPKNPSRMTLAELRELADSMDVEYADSDSRSDIMKKIRGEK